MLEINLKDSILSELFLDYLLFVAVEEGPSELIQIMMLSDKT